jgi:hypothetical protein
MGAYAVQYMNENSNRKREEPNLIGLHPLPVTAGTMKVNTVPLLATLAFVFSDAFALSTGAKVEGTASFPQTNPFGRESSVSVYALPTPAILHRRRKWGEKPDISV